MDWVAKVSFSAFQNEVMRNLRSETKGDYKFLVGCAAILYKEKCWSNNVRGGADAKWLEFFERAKGGFVDNWKYAQTITHDNLRKLKDGGSAIEAAYAFHYSLHASSYKRDRRYARCLDRAAFGQPAAELFGSIFVEDKRHLQIPHGLRNLIENEALVDRFTLRSKESPASTSFDFVDLDFCDEVGQPRFHIRLGEWFCLELNAGLLQGTCFALQFTPKGARDLPVSADPRNGRVYLPGVKSNDELGYMRENTKSHEGAFVLIATPTRIFDPKTVSRDDSGAIDDTDIENITTQFLSIPKSKRHIFVAYTKFD